MSRDNIKVGRYSKTQLRQKEHVLADYQRRKLFIPYLAKSCDAFDIVVANQVAFSSFFTIDWDKEIEGFSTLFQNAQNILQRDIFGREQFLDLYQCVGVEIDDRRDFAMFTEAITNVSFSYFVRAVKNLPGMNDFSHEDFCSCIVKNIDDLILLIVVACRTIWKTDELLLCLSDKYKLTVKKSFLSKLTEQKIVERNAEIAERMAQANLTFEEATFLIALDMSSPSVKYAHIKNTYNRFISGFSKYLENQYGKDYHLRLANLVNLMAFLKEKKNFNRQWMRKNEDYVNIIYKKDSIKLLYMYKPFSQILEMIKRIES